MAISWNQLGGTHQANRFYGLVAYNEGLAFISTTKEVRWCEATGANEVGIGTPSSDSDLRVFVFKDDLYVFSNDSPRSATIYRYVSGTTWTKVFEKTSATSSPWEAVLPVLIVGDTIVVCAKSDWYDSWPSALIWNYGDTVWKAYQSSDGDTWTEVEKPNSNPYATNYEPYDGIWRVTHSVSDYQGRVYMPVSDFSTPPTVSTSNLSYFVQASGASTFSETANLKDLGYYQVRQEGCTARSAAAIYIQKSGSLYRSIDGGTTWNVVDSNFTLAESRVFSVGGVDFGVKDDPYDYHYNKLTYYKQGDAIGSATELLAFPYTAGGSFFNAVRLGDTLIIQSGVYFFELTGVTDEFEWPPDPTPPIPPAVEHQLVQSISTPFMGGDYFWTTWLNGTTLQLHKRAIENGEVVSSIDICDTNVNEIISGSYAAYVTAYDDDNLFVYGRMNNAFSNTGTFHIMKSEEGGTGSWITIEDSWGSDLCGSIVLTNSNDYWAIRNGSTINLYNGRLSSEEVTQYSTLPLDSPVNRGAFTISQSGNLYAAASEGNSVMVVMAAPPYTVWSDITSNHVTDSGVKRLVSFE